jgi:hypothetical protein
VVAERGHLLLLSLVVVECDSEKRSTLGFFRLTHFALSLRCLLSVPLSLSATMKQVLYGVRRGWGARGSGGGEEAQRKRQESEKPLLQRAGQQCGKRR